VTPDGVLGAGPEHSWIVDVHHRAHPETKNPDGEHGVSVGFTSHYAAMRERFGPRIELGCAGENIVVETDRRLTLDELRGGLAFRSPDGVERTRLQVLDVAHPCRPFTGWALGGRVESEVLKSHLQFLDDGMRGFYCLGVGNGIVSVGDTMVLL
jgi:MOSC domain-containing protein YiiM